MLFMHTGLHWQYWRAGLIWHKLSCTKFLYNQGETVNRQIPASGQLRAALPAQVNAIDIRELEQNLRTLKYQTLGNSINEEREFHGIVSISSFSHAVFSATAITGLMLPCIKMKHSEVLRFYTFKNDSSRMRSVLSISSYPDYKNWDHYQVRNSWMCASLIAELTRDVRLLHL